MTIPVSWPVRPLSQVVDVLDSRRVPVKASDRAARSGSVPYYGATGQAGWIDEPLFNEPLVLLGEDGAPFLDPYKPKAYLIDGPAWVNNHAHVLRARTGLDRRFLRYYLDYFDYRGFANGTTRLKLTQAAMRGIPVPTPPVEVQSCLVDIIEDHLSRLDAANSCLDQAMVRIQSLNEQIIRQALIGADRTDTRIEPTLADAGTDDSVLVPLPRGWSWARLGEVADVVGGVTKDSKRQTDQSLEEVPYLRVANVQRGYLDLREIAKIRVAPNKVRTLELQVGDVLLNEGGDRDKLARGWVWEGQVPGAIHQNHVFRARIRTNLDPYFLSLTANAFGAPWAMRNGKQSVNLASISQTMIRKMPVIVPPAGESQGIATLVREKLEATTRLQGALTTHHERSRSLRRAVLAAAFSGRLTATSSDLWDAPPDPKERQASRALDESPRPLHQNRLTVPILSFHGEVDDG